MTSYPIVYSSESIGNGSVVCPIPLSANGQRLSDSFLLDTRVHHLIPMCVLIKTIVEGA